MESLAERQEASSQAFAPLTWGAVGAGIAGSVLAAVLGMLHVELVRYALLWAALAGMSGVLAAPLEQDSKASSWGLRLSVLIMGGNLLVARLVYDVRPVSLVIMAPLALVAVLAPIYAARVQSGRISLARYLLTLGLAPVVVTGAVMALLVLSKAGGIKAELGIAFTFAAPYGPWATLVGHVLAMPNAGEGFSIMLAAIFTIVFGAVLYVVVTRPRKAAYFLLPAAWLWIGWLAVGAAQVLSCLE